MNSIIVDATNKHKIVDFKNYKRTLLDPGSADCFHYRIPPWNMFDLSKLEIDLEVLRLGGND